MKRQFCRRYGIDPRSEISRRDVIEDAAFAEYETDGELPAERIETVLSAIYYVITLIASHNGIDPHSIKENAGNVYATRPQKFKPLSREEQEKREDEETRRSFAGTLSKIKTAIQHGQNTIDRL